MKFIAVLLLCSLAVPVLAQQRVVPPDRGYHVLSYHVTLDWRPVFLKKSAKFSGSNEITLRTDTGLNTIVLDASHMRIDSVLVDGEKLGLTPEIASDTLPFAFSNFVSSGSTLNIKVYYTHSSTNENGLYYYPKGTQSTEWDPVLQQSVTVLTTEDLAYTMSEPLDAHKWMPCNDEPDNKVHSAMSIIVPSGYSAQSNGSLAKVDTNVSDGSHVYHWVSDEPIATYLMAANASRWKTWQDYYHRFSNAADSVPVVYYCWPSDDTTNDESGSLYNAHYAYRNTPKMLAEYSKRFGEYPFIKYAQVPVQPFNFGGMEHQSISTIHRSWLRGIYEDGIAHELMHQWFGDKVTCETWADIWLNEGFATMGEWVWEEANYGVMARNYVLQSEAQRFFNPYTQYGETNTIPTYNPPISNVFNVQTTYMKPGLVLYMLRRALNDDSVFFGTLRDYNDAFAYSTCNTFQFRDYLEQHIASKLPVDPAEFINEWIFRPDYPKYTIAWNQSADNTLFIKVDQAPDSSDHYAMPLRFFAIAGSDTTPIMFVNDKRSQLFSAHLDRKIDDLAFDHLSTIVSTYTIASDATLAGVSGETAAEHYLHALNTAGGVRLSFEPAVGASAQVELLDVLGRRVQSIPLPAGATMTTLMAPVLPACTYFVRLIDGATQQSSRLELP